MQASDAGGCSSFQGGSESDSESSISSSSAEGSGSGSGPRLERAELRRRARDQVHIVRTREKYRIPGT